MKIKKKAKKIYHKIWENTDLNYFPDRRRKFYLSFDNIMNLKYKYYSDRNHISENDILWCKRESALYVTYVISLSPYFPNALEIIPFTHEQCKNLITASVNYTETLSKITGFSRFLYETDYFKFHDYATLTVKYDKYADFIYQIQIIYSSKLNKIDEIYCLKRDRMKIGDNWTYKATFLDLVMINTFSAAPMKSTIPIKELCFNFDNDRPNHNYSDYDDYPKLKIKSLPVIPISGIKYVIEKDGHGQEIIYDGKTFMCIFSYCYTIG